MSEPNEQKDVLDELTPAVPDATPETIVTQPVEPTVPVVNPLEAELLETQRLAKRYKEQLAGKDRIVETLKAENIARSLQPSVDVPEEYDETIASQPRQTSLQDQLVVSNAIKTNKILLRDTYANDKNVPLTKEVLQEVEAELDSWDSSGRMKLGEMAWVKAYEVIKGRRLEVVKEAASLKSAAEKQVEIDAIKQKEKEKVTAVVESPVQTEVVESQVSLDDVLTGKVQMSANEMLAKFPELLGQFKRDPRNFK